MFIVSYLIDFVIIFCMFCVVFLWLYHVSCTIYHNVCVFVVFFFVCTQPGKNGWCRLILSLNYKSNQIDNPSH